MEPYGLSPDPGMTLAKAAVRASTWLGTTRFTLAQTLGVSESTVEHILRGEVPIEPESETGEKALALVRLHQSLMALVGDDDRQLQAWMSGHNTALGGRPMELMQRAQGLGIVLKYLDSMSSPL